MKQKMNKQKQIINIMQQEQAYWHIPKIKIAWLPLLGLILFTLLSIGNFQLIDKNVLHEIFSSDTCKENSPCKLELKDLINFYPIFMEYVLISLALISFFAIFKRGYSGLKSYDEEGLIGGLIPGLIGGLIPSLIGGLIGGLIGEFD